MNSNLNDTDLENLLKRHFGRDEFEPGQKEIIASVLSGRDILVVAHRGSDQSICYKLPALVLDGLTLIVSRTDQAVETEKTDLLPATYINSSMPAEHLQKRIWDMAQGKYRLVYVGPEQFRNRDFLFAATKIPISLLVVEDAHCISRWGHDFRSDYLHIGKAIMELASFLKNPRVRGDQSKNFPQIVTVWGFSKGLDSQPCILALAGACTQRTRDDISHQLQIDGAKGFTLDPARSDLSLEVISAFSPEEKYDALRSVIRKLEGQGIIYTNSRHQTVEISESLKEFEPKVAFHHGGLEREKRIEVERAFKSANLRIVVATTTGSFGASLVPPLGKGLSSVLPFEKGPSPVPPFEKGGLGGISNPSDRSNIRYIIHFDMPDRPERYYQQISMAGGDGGTARCILMYSPSDRGFHQSIIEKGDISSAEIWRINEVLERDAEDGLVVLPYGQMELETAIDRSKLHVALRAMEDAGMLSVLPDCSMQARARILVPRDELTAYAEDETGRSVAEWLLDSSRTDPEGEIYIDFSRLKEELSYPHDILEDSLLTLYHAEAISYRPSRKGIALRLIEILDPSLTYDVFEKLKESRYQALKTMEEYVHTRECRQRFLYNYLGCEMENNCGNCDNCVSAASADLVETRHVVPLPHYARVALELVNRSEGRLSKDVLVKILAGLEQRTTRFDKWKEFGALSIFTLEDILRMFDLLIGHGFLKEEGEAHPPVELTRKGFRALEGELEIDDEKSITSLAEDMERIAQNRGVLQYAPTTLGEQKADSELDKALIAILQCAEKTDGQVGRWGLAKILRGQKSKKLAKYGFDHIEEYGSLTNMPKEAVLESIDAMIERGCLAVTSFFFPMLRLTEVGRRRLDRMK